MNYDYKLWRMKKWILLLLCCFSLNTLVWADDEKPIQVGQLPTKAQTFISTYFKGHKIALAKVESDLFSKSYDVIFTDGDKLEFDKRGDWVEISCKKEGVPMQAVPETIRLYVQSNYENTKILKIERSSKEYEVELSNRLELTFDKEFHLIDIDD